MCKIGMTKHISGGKPMDQENKNLESFESENSKEPAAKKMAKASAFIYLGLAIAVVITATVGIFSISYDYEDALSNVSFPEVDLGVNDISVPQIIIKPDDIVSDELPVGNEQSDVIADVSTPEERVMYYAPVEGTVIKKYSMDALVYSETMGDYRVHSGIDIAAAKGSPVVAYTDGVISSVTDDYFYGMTVAITHDRGIVTYYMNLDPILAANIAVGSEVVAGQTIGNVGDGARIESADSSHLHFEMRVNDVVIDPEKELP